jgi:flagellar assembly factor FliW
MKINTTRFGEIPVEESNVITMTGPILGFAQLERYILIVPDEKKPLWWLQSVEDGSVAFVVADPFAVKPDYEPEVPEDIALVLQIERPEDAAVLTIVTIRKDPLKVTLNLKAPLIINPVTKRGGQVVLVDPEQPIRFDVTDSLNLPGRLHASRLQRLSGSSPCRLRSDGRKLSSRTTNCSRTLQHAGHSV